MKNKISSHAEGSLEHVVENLVKAWEFERSHKTNPDQHTVANHEGFFLSANGGKKFGHKEAAEVGNYNVLLESADAALWDNEKITDRESHEIFHGAFPAFAWEILKVYTGPPTVHFEWRHFGRFTGVYKGHQGKGELIDVHGYGIANVNESLQLMDTQIFYDQETFLKVMEGKLPVSALGHENPRRAIDEVLGKAEKEGGVPCEDDAPEKKGGQDQEEKAKDNKDAKEGQKDEKPWPLEVEVGAALDWAGGGPC